jgi:hypothetical protein
MGDPMFVCNKQIPGKPGCFHALLSNNLDLAYVMTYLEENTEVDYAYITSH